MRRMQEATRALVQQNKEQQRGNHKKLLRTQAMEARERELQEQLRTVRENPQILVDFNHSQEIQRLDVPLHFREPAIWAYEGSKDPHNHIAIFQTQMFNSEGDNVVNYKMFVGALKDVELRWFISLLARSVTTSKIYQLASPLGSPPTKINIVDLFNLHQG